MSLNEDYQKLEPGDEVRLYEVDGTAFGTGEVLRFHSYSLAHTEAEIVAAGGDEDKLPAKSIWWQGRNTMHGHVRLRGSKLLLAGAARNQNYR